MEYNYEEEEEEEDEEKEEQENENKDNNNKEDIKKENGKVEENNINNEIPEIKEEDKKEEEKKEEDKAKDDLENLGKNYIEGDGNIISTSSEKEENKNKENTEITENIENKKEQIIEEIDTTVPKNNTDEKQGGENVAVKGISQNTICHRLIPKGLDIDITKRVYFKCYKMKTKSNIISFITGSKKVKIPYLIFLDENFYYMMKDKPVNENNENIRRVGNKYDLTKISNFQTRKINDEYEFAFEFMYEDYFDRIYKLLYFEPKDAELFFDVFQQFVDNLGLDLPGNVIGIGDRDEKEEEEEEEEDEGDEGEEKEEKEENENEENEEEEDEKEIKGEENENIDNIDNTINNKEKAENGIENKKDDTETNSTKEESKEIRDVEINN